MSTNITVHIARIADDRAARSFYETDYPTLHALIANYCLQRWQSHMPTDSVMPTDDAQMIDLFFETKEIHDDTLQESSMTFPLPPPFSSTFDLLTTLGTIERIAKGMLTITAAARPATDARSELTTSLAAIERYARALQALAGDAIAAASTPANPLSTESTTPQNHDTDPESGHPPPHCRLVPPP